MPSQSAEHFFTSCRTPFGVAFIGASAVGISCLDIFETPSDRGLRERISLTSSSSGTRPQRTTELLQSASTLLQRGEPLEALPLDVRGTPFQEEIWRYLRTISCGETQTYAEVASGVGRPKAVRAVARACAGNRIALAIPCHRVIREDGSLGGYRWGVSLKERLLVSESKAAPRGRQSRISRLMSTTIGVRP